MARATTPAPTPHPANLTVEQMSRGIERLNKRVGEVEALNVSRISRQHDPDIGALEKSIEETLQKVFGAGTIEYSRYHSAATLDANIMWYTETPGPSEVQPRIAERRAASLATLRQAVRGLEEEVAERSIHSPPAVDTSGHQRAAVRKVFIVHGHDEGARELLATFLRKADFEAVILHEQANQGRTVIEKVEAHSEVGFAVVLLTPDDVGSKKGGETRPRARQNVLLELGYFVGRLGRKHVCAMKRGDVEVPSDWQGVVNTEFDAHGGWRQALARELEAAGHDIDWKKAMS